MDRSARIGMGGRKTRQLCQQEKLDFEGQKIFQFSKEPGRESL